MKHKNLTRRSFAATTAWAALATLAGCGTAEEPAEETPAEEETTEILYPMDEYEQLSTTLFVFDTVVTIMASCPQELIDEAESICEYFENIFSRTIEDSDVGRINAAGGAPVEVAEETADAIQLALAYSEETGGLFDITIGCVSTLWDFSEGIKPADAEIQEGIKHIDYTKVKVEGTTVTLEDPDCKIDLGGIAKGYIADYLYDWFRAQGVESACINLGGDVKLLGERPAGGSWRVGVQDPNDDYQQVIAVIEASNMCVVTSGLYERNFTDDEGNYYYHILDKTTGYPTITDLNSSSIYLESGAEADVIATTLFILGHDAALEFCEARGIEALLIDAENNMTQTSGNLYEAV